MPEGSPPSGREQARTRFTLADALTLVRLPLAVLFVAVPDTGWRLGVLLLAGATDLLDGFLARWLGSSRLGGFLDPVADKLFMAATFGVLARDAVATIAFIVTAVSGRPSAIPARLGGKAVTLCQMLTLIAFVVGSPLLRPLAWATGAIALYAIWDYSRAAGARRRL
jgi:CDP-diacylglycerol---glycerol-3-phosphate 3-phosphatidyltransferase